MSRFIYTKGLLESAAASSRSVAQVIDALGLPWSGGRHSTVKTKLQEFGIDTRHFDGQGANRGQHYRGGCARRAWQDVLKLRSKRRESAFRLRRALIETGRPYKCGICGLEPSWNGRELRLPVDHIDGNWLDCRPDNLRFLCPNCHSQTETFGKNVGGTDVTSDAAYYRMRRRNKTRGRGGI